MKKTISSVLLTAIFLSLLASASCGGGNVDTPVTSSGADTTSGETTAEEKVGYDDDIPADLNFGGETINVFSRAHFRFNDEVTVDEANGDVVNDAIYDREIAVEDRLGVKIENFKDNPEAGHGSIDKMQKMILAGDDTYDIFTASMYHVAPAAANGIFTNLFDVEYIDTTKPYYTQDYIAKSQMGGNLYAITGDISLSLLRYSFAMYFNKTLVDSYGLEDPYALVRDGKWTHDKLTSMVTDIYSDLNGDGKQDDEDLYGLGTSNVIIVDAYCSAYKMNMMDVGDDGFPYFSIDLDKFSSAVDKIFDLNWQTNGVHAYKEISDNNEMTDLCNYFSQDHLVFIHNWLYASETSYLRDMKSDYGIIPYPKYDENQDGYYTFQHDQIGLFTIPVTSTKKDMAGAVLEAMSSESSKTVVPSYYEVALKSKYSRDSESAEMIDIIHNGHMLDPAWIYCSYIGDLAQAPRNLMLKEKRDFMSFYDSNKSKYQKNLDKLIKDFKSLEETN